MASTALLNNTITTTEANMRSNRTDQQQQSLAGDFNQFLTLLVTQLQNQDPMDPMDSSEFTSQLVMFNQVEQQINTNQKLDALVQLQIANVTSAALGFVGLDVTYPAAEMNFDGENPVSVFYELKEDPISATINVRNEKGDLVYTADVAKDVGLNEVTWDGSHMGGGFVEPGTYAVSIDALNHEDKPIQVTTVVSGRVRGIESQEGQIFLLVGDRAVSAGSIINAYEPEGA